ncbi:MAG: NRDE family protein [Parahaliea sp.]
MCDWFFDRKQFYSSRGPFLFNAISENTCKFHALSRLWTGTNYRDSAQTTAAPLSRGKLPLQWLTGNSSAGCFLEQTATRSHHYAGFNLLIGDHEALWYYSNTSAKPSLPRRLEPGIYDLSNVSLDTP